MRFFSRRKKDQARPLTVVKSSAPSYASSNDLLDPCVLSPLNPLSPLYADGIAEDKDVQERHESGNAPDSQSVQESAREESGFSDGPSGFSESSAPDSGSSDSGSSYDSGSSGYDSGSSGSDSGSYSYDSGSSSDGGSYDTGSSW